VSGNSLALLIYSIMIIERHLKASPIVRQLNYTLLENRGCGFSFHLISLFGLDNRANYKMLGRNYLQK
jgi:hypothetical protein